MCKAESAGRDILTAGGRIQLLCFSLAATAPTSGGPRPPQRSCPNPVHLQRVVVLGVVWGGVGWGWGDGRRRSILQGVALQSCVMYCRGMCRSVGLLHLCGTAAFVKCAHWVQLSSSSQSVVNLQKKKNKHTKISQCIYVCVALQTSFLWDTCMFIFTPQGGTDHVASSQLRLFCTNLVQNNRMKLGSIIQVCDYLDEVTKSKRLLVSSFANNEHLLSRRIHYLILRL